MRARRTMYLGVLPVLVALASMGAPYVGGTSPIAPLELLGLLMAAIAGSAFVPASRSDGRLAFSLPLVVEFSALLLAGSHPAMLVALAGLAARIVRAPGSRPPWRILLEGIGAIAAVQAAAVAHAALGGSLRHFVWPWEAVPIAAAAAAYGATKLTLVILLPSIVRGGAAVRVLGGGVRGWPSYVVGVGLAAAFVEIIDHHAWALASVVALPVFFLSSACRAFVERLDEKQRRREIAGACDEGLAMLDEAGVVTSWDDAVERLLACPRARAIGRPLAAALPELAAHELPRVFGEVLQSRTARTLPHVAVATGEATRMVEIKVLPVTDGAALLCRDVTERVRAEQTARRTEERLTLAAEGAHDGLWEWDLQTRQFYASGRWKSILGLPADASVSRPEDWLDRVHADDIDTLKAAIEAHLAGRLQRLEHEHRVRHEDGAYRWCLCRAVAARGAGGRPVRVAGSLSDTMHMKAAEERLRSAAFVDPLTGLSNRTVFVEGLGRRLEQLKQRPGGGRFAVLYLDIDRFKLVNDSLGHLVGDELLIAVSRRLESCLRQGDLLARLGGDEFAILLNGLADEQQANAIAFRIHEALGVPFSIAGREVFTSASIGIAFGLTQYTTPDEIMRDADTAMYHAKARGKARHELFDADMHARARDRLGLESDLRRAVQSNDFEVHYQPIVLLASRQCVGFESLVRWRRNGEAISPAVFIPIAEELGLVEAIGTWVLRQACRTFAEWQRRFPDAGLECITVNVSSRQLMQQNLLFSVEQAVHAAGLSPSSLCLEVTESALMVTPHAAAEVLRDLQSLGVKIYLDDFGTGYSSLSHLHKLPVDALKIDRSFVRSLLLPDRPAIVESILALARTLETSVIAEGIETDAEACELERLGCTHAQGYLFCRSLSELQAQELIRAGQPLCPARGPGPAPPVRSTVGTR